MTPDNSLLVPSRLVPVRCPQGFYSKGLWAEPDSEWAVEALRYLRSSGHACQELGRKAKASIEAEFGNKLAGQYATRLQGLRQYLNLIDWQTGGHQ